LQGNPGEKHGHIKKSKQLTCHLNLLENLGSWKKKALDCWDFNQNIMVIFPSFSNSAEAKTVHQYINFFLFHLKNAAPVEVSSLGIGHVDYKSLQLKIKYIVSRSAERDGTFIAFIITFGE